MRTLLASAATATVLAAGAPLVLAASADDPTGSPVAGAAHQVDAAPIVASPPEAEHDHRSAETVERPVVSRQPAVEVMGASREERFAVAEALARFRSAGLLLPDVEIVFSDDEAACDGHDGLFQTHYSPWRVSVCSDLEFVVTHELAHAWEAANLDDADRVRYVELRGLPTWDSPSWSWGERGIEDVAFIVQQNLMAKRVNPESAQWIERTRAYEALTSRPSPVLANPSLTHGPR